MNMGEKIVRNRESARRALDAYELIDRTDPDATTAIQDLIVNLLHLAEDYGVPPSAMDDYVASALEHYDYESDPENADREV